MTNTRLVNGVWNTYPGALNQGLYGSPDQWIANSATYWCGDSPRNGRMCGSIYTTIVDGAGVNPEVHLSDNAVSNPIAGKLQTVNNSGKSVFGGSETAHIACWGANNVDAAAGGTQGGLCVTSDGITAYVPGYGTFANNAAAVAAGLPNGALYRIAGTDAVGIVHP